MSAAGFDAFVGNPPFAGKNTLAAEGTEYADWLKTIHEGSHGNSDLVAHFFRRAFSLLAPGGTFGLLATNTIAQGDTRATGLRSIVKNGGVIYDATRRYKWPGMAAVVTSIVHVARAPTRTLSPRLDGKSVSRISAFLFHQGGDEDPSPLGANADKSFQGSIVLGMGFTFDDANADASPIAEMERLIAKNPKNSERIFPYLGGDEVNTSPTHAHDRYVINFAQMTEEEARSWPDLIKIVEDKVRPEREKLADNPDGRRRKKFWWQWGRYTPALYEALRGLTRFIAIARVSRTGAFAFLPASVVPSEQLVVFALESYAAFAVLQSRTHESWARLLGSTMKDDLRYTPSDCFETFPFPAGWQQNDAIEAIGRTYVDYRASVMTETNEGLTETYNRFHDPDDRSPAIVRLRELHDEVDRAVLDAYGWRDVRPVSEFILDYDESDEEDADSRRRKKRKPWRYRWLDDIRDDVLARLLVLNAERAAAERLMGEEARLPARAGTVAAGDDAPLIAPPRRRR